MRRLHVIGLCVAIAGSLLGAAPANAQPDEPTVSDKETARGLVGTGHERVAAGDHEGALRAYRQAHDIMGVPTTGLFLAKTQLKLGRLLQARDTLLEVRDYPKKPDEPEPFARAREEAEGLLAETRKRIPTLKLALTTDGEPLPEDVSVTLAIEGKAYEGLAARVPRKVNPGTHRIAVSAPGYRTVRREVEVEEAEQARVEVDLEPGRSEPVGKASPGPEAGGNRPDGAPGERPPADGPDRPREDDDALATALMGVGFAVGGAGVVAGAITGGLSWSAASETKEMCPSLNGCPEAARDPHDRAITLANASNATFAIGAVGTAVGVVGLVLWQSADGAANEDDRTSLRLGPAGVRWGGSF